MKSLIGAITLFSLIATAAPVKAETLPVEKADCDVGIVTDSPIWTSETYCRYEGSDGDLRWVDLVDRGVMTSSVMGVNSDVAEVFVIGITFKDGREGARVMYHQSGVIRNTPGNDWVDVSLTQNEMLAIESMWRTFVPPCYTGLCLSD